MGKPGQEMYERQTSKGMMYMNPNKEDPQTESSFQSGSPLTQVSETGQLVSSTSDVEMNTSPKK